MLVEIIDCPQIGKRGDLKDIPDNEAEVLILIGAAKKAERPVKEVAALPVKEPAPKKRAYKKRTYKRRDMVAEQSAESVSEPDLPKPDFEISFRVDDESTE